MAVKDQAELAEHVARAREAAGELEDAMAAIAVSVSQGAGAAETIDHLLERYGVDQEALLAFLDTLHDVLGDRSLSVPAARRAALLAASELAWESELGPLLSSAQARELLGAVSRQRVDELLRARRLIGLLDGAGRRRFPAFQFRDGRPLEPLIAAFWLLADAAASDWTAAAWCTARDDALGGLSPVQWVREDRSAERLRTVARQDAARLAQ